MTQQDRRLTMICWGKTDDLAVTGYVEKIIAELGKHLPVKRVNMHINDSVLQAMNLVNAGRVENWISICNIGNFQKTFVVYAGQEHVHQFVAAKRVRYISMAFDWELEILGNYPAKTISTSFTRSILEASSTFIQRPALLGVLPHAWSPEPQVPWEKREIDILFPGHLRDEPEQVRQRWAELPHNGQIILESVLDQWRAEPNKNDRLPIHFAHLAALQHYGEGYDGSRLITVVNEFDHYLRCQARFDLVARVNQVPITFIGSGWDRYPGPNRRILPAMPQSKVLEMVRKSKLVLNMSTPYFKSHERVFYGMAMGVPVGTYGSGFLANAGDTAPNEPIVYLEPETLADTLSDRISQPEGLRDLAREANKRFLAHHTWKHRARTLLGLIQEANLKMPL
jgi:hypothetical protein